ncbi:MAG TPA: ThiF family adenylyltransferase [Gemmatimonadales bacterium]|nr:ThiF family adenylyltransferase [Gemmatimonadales bacterium]
MRGISDEPKGEFSLWEFGRPGEADGPDRMAALSLGRVLQVGARAVGSSVDFFLALLGLSGEWTIVDGDAVHAPNLNRHLLFLAQGVGYQQGSPRNEARIAAKRLGRVAKAHAGWYQRR